MCASFLLLSGGLFCETVAVEKARCEVEAVKNCLGGVSYHCFAPTYKVVCSTQFNVATYNEATRLQNELEGKTVKFE